MVGVLFDHLIFLFLKQMLKIKKKMIIWFFVFFFNLFFSHQKYGKTFFNICFWNEKLDVRQKCKNPFLKKRIFYVYYW